MLCAIAAFALAVPSHAADASQVFTVTVVDMNKKPVLKAMVGLRGKGGSDVPYAATGPDGVALLASPVERLPDVRLR